ncbi:hypothetical protein ACHWQZ_G010482 [Mnemiopsis leidyi]
MKLLFVVLSVLGEVIRSGRNEKEEFFLCPGQEEQLLKLLTRRDCPREDRKTVVKRDVIRVMLELPGREVEKEMLTEDEEVIHICSRYEEIKALLTAECREKYKKSAEDVFRLVTEQLKNSQDVKDMEEEIEDVFNTEEAESLRQEEKAESHGQEEEEIKSLRQEEEAESHGQEEEAESHGQEEEEAESHRERRSSWCTHCPFRCRCCRSYWWGRCKCPYRCPCCY